MCSHSCTTLLFSCLSHVSFPSLLNNGQAIRCFSSLQMVVWTSRIVPFSLLPFYLLAIQMSREHIGIVPSSLRLGTAWRVHLRPLCLEKSSAYYLYTPAKEYTVINSKIRSVELIFVQMTSLLLPYRENESQDQGKTLWMSVFDDKETIHI